MNFQGKCDLLEERIKKRKQADNLCFILCDKFGRALRNCTNIVPSLRPDIVISERGNPGSDFTLENTGDSIGSRHYLHNGEDFHKKLMGRIAPKQGRIFSWTEKKQLPNVGIFLCESEKVRAYVEDKTNLLSILSEAGINTERFSLRQELFASKEEIPAFSTLQKRYGLPFVMQGWSKGGDGTLIVENEDDFQKKNTLCGGVRISEFCDYQYSSIYACIIPNGERTDGIVIMDRPSHKVVGVKQNGISNVFGGGCDWSQIADIDHQETFENVKKIGLYLLRKFGYKGALMLEGFFIDDKFVFNELNARLGGGNEVSGFNQLLHEEIPIQAIHYGLQLGVDCYDLIRQDEFQGKHFNKSSGGCFYIKMVGKGNEDFQVGNLKDGLYSYNGGRLHFGERYEYPHLTWINDGRITIANLPQPQTHCKKNTHIGMIEGVAFPNEKAIIGPKDVSQTIAEISDLIYKSLTYV